VERKRKEKRRRGNEVQEKIGQVGEKGREAGIR